MPQSIYKINCDDAIQFLVEAVWGFAEISAKGDFIWVNPAYCHILNAPADLILGTNFAQWTHPEDIEIDKSLSQQVATNGIPGYTLAKRYIQRGSTPQKPRIVWGMLSATGKWNQTGEFLGYRVQFRPYELNDDPKRWFSEIKKATLWVAANWKTTVTVLAVLSTLIFGSSEKLSDILKKAQETKELVDGVSPP